MKISTINYYLNQIYISTYSTDISENQKSEYELYASYYLQNDPIGMDILRIFRKKFIMSSIFGFFSIIFGITYIVLFILYPIFYSFFDNIIFFKSFKSLSFGFIDCIHNLKWYWNIGLHIISLIVFGGIFVFINEEILNSYTYQKKLKAYLINLIINDKINEKNILKKNTTNNEKNMKNKKTKISKKNIFIVHGHDSLPIEKSARFIEKIGLNSIILHEQSSEGKTIIEKFEKHSNVAFAIVLLTPDDEIYNKSNQISMFRAKQNVVFEFGYLMAKLGRNRVCALVKDNVELPSDINGIVYIPLDKNGAWKMKISKEMKAAKIDANYSAIL